MLVGYVAKLYGCTWYTLELSSQYLSYERATATSEVGPPKGAIFQFP
jgi:hypothetical protein